MRVVQLVYVKLTFLTNNYNKKKIKRLHGNASSNEVSVKERVGSRHGDYTEFWKKWCFFFFNFYRIEITFNKYIYIGCLKINK